MNLTIGVYVGTTWGTKGMNRMTISMKNLLPGVYSQGRWLHVCRTCVQSSLSWQHSLDFKALKIARFNISILRWIWIALNCSKLSLHRRISSSPPLIQILFSCFLEWTHSLKLNFLLGSNSSFPQKVVVSFSPVSLIPSMWLVTVGSFQEAVSEDGSGVSEGVS